jgi:phospholipid transport system substrate-binding protein
MRLAIAAVAFALSFLPAPAFAQQTAQTAQLGPEELVRQITGDVLDSIKSDRQLQGGDKRKALELAEKKVLPHVDFREAVKLAAGKTWQTATPEQQDRLASAFRSMLIRIYSNAIDVYRGQTMKVLPVRMQPGATEVTVRNQYLAPGRPPVIVEYAMKKEPDGWKIYDIVIEGVSLVLTYRAEFEQVARTSGIDGLIKRLNEKNA